MDYIRPQTYVVVASHGNYDEAALQHVLPAKPRYVGLVASRKRYESVVGYLKAQGLSDDDLALLKAPAGLDIGAQEADEIALSIMAEIVQHRRRTGYVMDWDAQLTTAIKSAKIALVEPTLTIDPVCGMEVTIAKAKATYEYEGSTYYFCCAGCKTAFTKNPEPYVQHQPATAIDPVCQMIVEIATAQYSTEYNGSTYYFCCAGCKAAFDKHPSEHSF
jgi:xanthine dehydrogenase accessory factor